MINLSGDKPAVLREMVRVLKPGGRIGISDVVAEDHLTAEDRAARGSFSGCIAGALSRQEYLDGLAAAGFERRRTCGSPTRPHRRCTPPSSPPPNPPTLRERRRRGPVADACCGAVEQDSCCEPAAGATDTAPTAWVGVLRLPMTSTAPGDLVDVLVVGAGQAGLAAGRALQQVGLRFLILEAADQPGGSWPRYYDSLTLFSPARFSALPGLPLPGDPDRYPTRDELTGYLRAYAAWFDLPVRTGARVVEVGWDDGSVHGDAGRR